jgi:hypothetical protein
MPSAVRTTLTPNEKAERNRRKARDWRAKMRAKGLRPVQLWVHDMRDPAFLEECRRQSIAAANSPTEAEDQAFIDAVSISFDELP